MDIWEDSCLEKNVIQGYVTEDKRRLFEGIKQCTGVKINEAIQIMENWHWKHMLSSPPTTLEDGIDKNDDLKLRILDYNYVLEIELDSSDWEIPVTAVFRVD